MTLPQQNGAIATKLLLVEGNDDLRFFNAMLQHLETTEGIADESSFNGKDPVWETICRQTSWFPSYIPTRYGVKLSA